MDAPYYNGDYDRDHPSVEDHCDQCGGVLYPEERANGRCVRCEQDALDAEAEDAPVLVRRQG